MDSGLKRPTNVVRFELLMYFTLVIGALNSLLTWQSQVARARPVGGAAFVLFILVSVFACMMALIWLTARRRKNWARWTLLIMAVLGLPQYVGVLRALLRDHPLVGVLTMVQTLVQAIAFVLIFSGDARDWFLASRPQIAGAP